MLWYSIFILKKELNRWSRKCQKTDFSSLLPIHKASRNTGIAEK